MAYQALYRVFRPQQFSDVVGQEHVTRTLQNALSKEKLSHAYLFSGPRGTGKTSVAKIVAKAVNCEQAPTPEPCNECSVCLGITSGSIQDVLEIDAASNNGVDEIRDIRDKVKFAPSSVTYKVYIIDEVHMLSTGAFNALLKTLEEPPKHVIFILATTEPHKIPLTIISRCQRFDFRRIEAPDIVSRLGTVVEAENIAINNDSLQALARAADGGMRDALSLLDQVVSFSEDTVQLEDVLSITGATSEQVLGQLVKAACEKNTLQALQSFHQLMKEGKDPNRLVEDLIFYYRDLLLYKTAPELENVLELVHVDEQFTSLSAQVTDSSIYDSIKVLNGTAQEMRWTNHPRIHMEVALVKLCHQREVVIQEDSNLLQRLITLEQQLANREFVERSEVTVSEKPRQEPKQRTSGYKVQTNRIFSVLKQATHQDLAVVKSRWMDVLDILRKNKRSQAALVQDTEPVAADATRFVLKFKYEIHCQMATEQNVRNNIESALEQLTGRHFELVAVPDSEWLHVREQFLSTSQEVEGVKEESIVLEARKLFGDLIEVVE